MNQIEKIDYMIKSLEVAKDEIEYAKLYTEKQQCDNFIKYSDNRLPNGTIMRESLRMVGRLANQVANEITLSQYCDELFKKQL